METVWITHPNLDGRTIEVSKQSLPHHQRSGWVETDPPPPPQPPQRPDLQSSEAPANAGASALPQPPKSRRSTSRKDD
ncbi:hypothetical protein [Nonomuraea sp. CA-141351]|uniref:hypothetical protein n=1 Tax=Nonomuraea sp. CA-141351 TaxID=3239996 RepID=UPI003D8ACCED